MNKKLKLEELNRPEIDTYKELDKLNIIVVLDQVRSLSNVGSIFRTCDAFSVKQLYLCGITGRPPHREIQKTALGATESVEWQYFETTTQALDAAKLLGYKIVSVEQCERSYQPQELSTMGAKLCLVLGNEVDGVSQSVVDASDFVVEIPQVGTKHSLNVTVAAGIVIWEAFSALSN